MTAIRAPTYTASEMLSIGISSPAAQELPRRIHQNAFDMHVLTEAGKSKYEEKKNELAETHNETRVDESDEEKQKLMETYKDETRRTETQWQNEQTASNETDVDMYHAEAKRQDSAQEAGVDEQVTNDDETQADKIQKVEGASEAISAKTEIAADSESIIHQLLQAVNNISLRGQTNTASNWPAPNAATRSKYSQYGPAVEETNNEEYAAFEAEASGYNADKFNEDPYETSPPREIHKSPDGTLETDEIQADWEEHAQEASFDSGTLPSLAPLENISDTELVLEWQRRRLQLRVDKLHNALLSAVDTLRNEMQRDISILDRIGHAQWQEWNDIINE